MFSRTNDASKAAMIELCGALEASAEFALLDCQVQSAHLQSLGASLLPRAQFAALLANTAAKLTPATGWPTERKPMHVA